MTFDEQARRTAAELLRRFLPRKNRAVGFDSIYTRRILSARDFAAIRSWLNRFGGRDEALADPARRAAATQEGKEGRGSAEIG